jgi:homoserine dehydrogenase
MEQLIIFFLKWKTLIRNFYKVLKKAQQLGYAEPGNPKLDLNGFDAFAKIRILSCSRI